jgi:hypothetical protein
MHDLSSLGKESALAFQTADSNPEKMIIPEIIACLVLAKHRVDIHGQRRVMERL